MCTVLEHLGYISGGQVTEAGQRLACLYTELDLLAAECLRRGLWDGLTPAELAACVSALTFESRTPEAAVPPRLPGGPVPGGPHRDGGGVERASTRSRRTTGCRSCASRTSGFAWAAHAWARGKPLESVLGPDLTPGDFVRAVKQLMDLLGQVAVAAGRDAPVSKTARAAVDALRRGVVTYSSVEDLPEGDVEDFPAEDAGLPVE